MSLYLNDKAGYKDIKETKGIVLPSPQLLYGKQSVFKPPPGVDTKSIQSMKDLGKIINWVNSGI